MDLFYDPADLAVLRDPHALFARLRAEDPVHWSPKLSGWVVTTHELCGRVLADADFSSDRLTPFFKRTAEAERSTLSEIMRYISLWMVFRNPPEHTRLRRLLNKAVNPNVVAGMEPQIASVVNMLLDKIDEDHEFDFMADFAIQLPAMVIMDMMGIPRDKLHEVKLWSDDLINFVGSPRSVVDKYERARSGLVAMVDYFGGLVAQRRVAPKDDILSYLISTSDDQGMMTDDEIVASAILLLFAGHETTTNLLGNALLALAGRPDQVQLLRVDGTVMTTAIEEFLRYDGPVLSITRVAAVTHEFGGKQIKENDRVFAMLIAANRDPAVFPDPNDLDLTRSPNRHIGFGRGIHFCLGAPLARLEAKIALTEIFRRHRSFCVMKRPEELTWVDAMVMRGVRGLPIRFERSVSRPLRPKATTAAALPA